MRKISPDKLKKTKSPATWKISTTNDIHLAKSRKPEPLIGQQRAFEAMEFGLRVGERGYNIFVVGQPGSGRTSYVLERLQSIGENLPTPDDWLYLYNFAKPSEPLAVSVSAGKGKKLSDDLDELLQDLKTVISRAFEQSQYEETKTRHIKEFQEKAGAIMDKLKARAEREHFSLKRTPQGFVNIPLVKDKDEEGKPIVRELKPEEYEALDAAKQKKYQAKSEKISQRTLSGMREIRDMEKALKDTLSKLDAEMCRTAISPIMEELRGKYSENEALQRWFDAMTDDIIENFGAFVTAARDENAEVDFTRYQANLFVSNDPSKGAPVIWETSPTYYNLSGRVEYESHQGYLYTDFRRILAGAFHKAN
ncbi:MAG: AAA family ATPase, partial [Synergistaceae bacterium]|nr:AAA family ATPase [Synergistaceae bacterium]